MYFNDNGTLVIAYSAFMYVYFISNILSFTKIKLSIILEQSLERKHSFFLLYSPCFMTSIGQCTTKISYMTGNKNIKIKNDAIKFANKDNQIVYKYVRTYVSFVDYISSINTTHIIDVEFLTNTYHGWKNFEIKYPFV
jgi:hypothetical protein